MLERRFITAVLVLTAFVGTVAAYAGAAFAPGARMARAAACHRAGLCPGLILRPAPGFAAPAPRRGRAAVVMMAKKKLTETQRKALEALEAFEAVTRVAVQEEGPSEEELEKEREKERKKEEKRLKKLAKKGLDPSAEAAAGASDVDDADEAPKANGAQIAKAAPEPANGKNKKGKMSEIQLRALEAVEAFEAASSQDSEEEEPTAGGKKVGNSGSVFVPHLSLIIALVPVLGLLAATADAYLIRFNKLFRVKGFRVLFLNPKP